MTWEEFIDTRLEADRREYLERDCRRLPEGILNFGENDYLGFSNHPSLIEASSECLKHYGMGSRASRLLSGHTPVHEDLEAAVASLKLTEAALSFPCGYSTAIGVIPALSDRHSTIILDEKCHACLWDGARVSGAKLRMMRHNDLGHLQEILEFERSRNARHTILLIAESLYSMDGDRAPLGAMIELKNRWAAWLVIDEAHATGVFGSRGQGLIDTAAMASEIEVQLGTLGKAIGALGGFAAGSEKFVRLLRQHARSFIFTTSSPPPVAAAALAGIRLILSRDGATRRKHLSQLVGHAANSPLHPLQVDSQIIPIPVRSEEKSIRIAEALWAENIYLPAIRFPTVPKGKARLRMSLNASHTTGEIDLILKWLKKLLPQH